MLHLYIPKPDDAYVLATVIFTIVGLLAALSFIFITRNEVKQAHKTNDIILKEFTALIDQVKRTQSVSDSLLLIHREKNQSQEELIALYQHEIGRLVTVLHSKGFDDQGFALQAVPEQNT